MANRQARPLMLMALSLAAVAGHAGEGRIGGVIVGPSGAPLADAWVMTSNGEVTHASADGTFAFTGLSDGVYAVKAVAAGMEEAIRSCVALTSGVPVCCRIPLQPSARGTALVAGQVTDAVSGKKIAAWFEVMNNSDPVRWFDAAGRPYGGRTDVPPAVWHQKNRRYWTSGDFAFSAAPGKLRLAARADGYAPASVERALRPGAQERLDIALRPLFDPASEGWFKGDFHAHGVHGENLYEVNVPLMAFILRAESYRWFYLSAGFNNDGVGVDNASVAASEGLPDVFLALNAEYPKTGGGHIGNLGIAPPTRPLPYPRFSNAETIKAEIADAGGAAVPLHPLYGHMRSKELPFLLLGAPELICGFDFYTSWNAASEKTWGMFLNKGYRLCRTATSDAAFDVGRTPGTMGGTFIHPAGGRLNRDTIVEAFKEGRTTLSWDGVLLLFTIDGAVCGNVFRAGDAPRKAVIGLRGPPGMRTLVCVTRNGETFRQFQVALPESGRADVAFDLVERNQAWFTATCAMEGHPEKVIAASSPFYVGDWKTPAPLLAQVAVTVVDAVTKAPLNAEISLVASGKAVATRPAEAGTLTLEARVFHRIRARAKGYGEMETGVLGAPAVAAFISSLSEQDLQDWGTYEKAGRLLKNVEINFALKRK